MSNQNETVTVALLQQTIKAMVQVLDSEIQNTNPEGDMSHTANHACLKAVKASYDSILAERPEILSDRILRTQRESLILELAKYDHTSLPPLCQSLVEVAVAQERESIAERVKTWVANKAEAGTTSIFDVILNKS